MMFLSGAKNPLIADDLAAGTIGLLQTPANGYRLDGVAVWAMDNGCFTGAYPGDDGYLSLLDSCAAHRASCLFVAVPDVVGDGAATLARWQPMASRIRERGWPVAMVAQDGMTPDDLPWGELDAVFLGGSTDWKLGATAAAIIDRAKSMGKHVHVGRVNSAKRFTRFALTGADSCDGTCIAFAPKVYAERVREWSLSAQRQPGLW